MISLLISSNYMIMNILDYPPKHFRCSSTYSTQSNQTLQCIIKPVTEQTVQKQPCEIQDMLLFICSGSQSCQNSKYKTFLQCIGFLLSSINEVFERKFEKLKKYCIMVCKSYILDTRVIGEF